ncbi:MAG: hypothetical protein ACRD9Y_08385 [Blastocatellia bacterium]
MNQQQTQAINRTGLDAAFEADEARKSNLILEAQLLREQSRAGEAARKFAEAAQIEESLSQRCAVQGLTEKSFLHRFSALSLWAQAGAFFIRRLRSATNCLHLLRCPNVCASGFGLTPIRSASDALIGMKN